jgi:uncharacterized protein involved in exopolysaccharide biosynthesis
VGQFITNHLLPQVYTATTRIQIRPHGVTGLPMASSRYTPPLQDEFSVMQSSDVLLPIIHDLGLKETWAKRIYKAKEGLADQDALAYFNKILKLDFVRGTNIINITIVDDDPKEAADITNAIADRYKAMRDVEEDQRHNRGLDALREQIAEQQKVVDDNKDPAEKPRQQALLDAFNVRLKQDHEDIKLEQSPVRIISRAAIPTKPDHPTAQMVTVILASLLSLLAASFVEIILLFLRASERHDN